MSAIIRKNLKIAHFMFSERYPVKLNVYRLKDSSIGFYHSGVAFKGHEYTYCCGVGICYHKPKKCHFASFLGTINLGFVNMDVENFRLILQGKLLFIFRLRLLKITYPIFLLNFL